MSEEGEEEQEEAEDSQAPISEQDDSKPVFDSFEGQDALRKQVDGLVRNFHGFSDLKPSHIGLIVQVCSEFVLAMNNVNRIPHKINKVI